jgi:putative SOS response-associated peptidase YedK
MCNLYTNKRSAAEIAALFRITSHDQFNTPEETYPGYPGMVVHEADGQRKLQSMIWGFPLRLKGMKPESKPKPVNNIADLTKSMWIGLARKPHWRCLIPVTAFAEAEGAKGSKTRTWFRVKRQPVFAWAGLWRESAEWGAVYSGVMSDCNEAIKPVHDRMPTLLLPDQYDRWMHGSFEDLLAFQSRCFPDDLIEMERTSEPWVKRKAASTNAELPTS